jgi:hypothetical protein
MYLATRELYKTTPTYYYTYSDTITTDYELKDDILYIKGKESYLPGILEKTIKAFRYFPMDQYDYVIRSNVSTVVDMERVKNHLTRNSLDYGGSFVHDLHWLDPGNGIVDKRHWGTKYVSGTCIILSKSSIEKLLQQQLDYSVIDDVAIGIALKPIKPVCFLERFKAVTEIPVKTDGRWWFYRHRTDDRFKDASHIKWLTKTLIHSLSTAGSNSST